MKDKLGMMLLTGLMKSMLDDSGDDEVSGKEDCFIVPGKSQRFDTEEDAFRHLEAALALKTGTPVWFIAKDKPMKALFGGKCKGGRMATLHVYCLDRGLGAAVVPWDAIHFEKPECPAAEEPAAEPQSASEAV